MTADSRSERSGYHHGDLRNALVDAAIGVLEDLGIAGLTLRSAAKRAGVSHTAPYNHFDNKQALLASIATEGFRRLEAVIASEGSRVSDSRDRLRLLGRIYLDFALSNRALYGLMFGEDIKDRSQYPDLLLADEATARHARDVTGACLSLSSRKPVDTEMAAVASWALVHGLADLLIGKHVHLPSGREPDEAFRAEMAELFLNALIPEDALDSRRRRGD